MGLLNEARDFGQAASNAVASNVSAPVDGIAWLLRKLGVNVGTPVGGSDWMAAQGLTRDVKPGAAQVLGETAGLLSPTVAAAKAPQIARGLLTMGENAAAPRTLSPQAGAIDLDAINAAISEQKDRLLAEAKDWAARKYKANEKAVFFTGDGPGPESMRIGAINEGRRNANVNSRLDQVRALNSFSDAAAANPRAVEVAYNQARTNAERDAASRGWNFDQTFDAYLGQTFGGMKDSSHGPGSIGRAIRDAIERGIKKEPTPASAPIADDWLTQLYGG